MEAEGVGHLGLVHGAGEILLVGKDEEDAVEELLFAEHQMQLVGGEIDALAIGAVDDVNDGVCVVVVISPRRSLRICMRF